MDPATIAIVPLVVALMVVVLVAGKWADDEGFDVPYLFGIFVALVTFLFMLFCFFFIGVVTFNDWKFARGLS